MDNGGNYRIDDIIFPAPNNTEWEPNVIGAGLNGIPRLNSYYKHRWQWDALDGSYMEALISLFLEQQTNGTQLSELETDPYDASGACKKLGVSTHIDFVILSVTPVTRGLPLYQSPSVEFEIFVS